jgi:membrane protease YdiL (CAAX protease family)
MNSESDRNHPAASSSGFQEILAFFAFLICYTWLAYWWLKRSGNYYLYMNAYMWSPALASLSAIAVTRRDFRTLGLRWSSLKSLAVAAAIPITYGLAAYLLIWIAGWGAFDTAQISTIAQKMGMTGWPAVIVLAVYVVLRGFWATLGNMPSSFGEELGWRGFLFPRLRSKMSFIASTVVVGIVWGLWHFPLIIHNWSSDSDTPLAFELVAFTVFTLGCSAIMNYLTERYHSVWPAVVLHSAHNFFILALFDGFTLYKPETALFAGETGLILPLITVIVGIYFWLGPARALQTEGGHHES